LEQQQLGLGRTYWLQKQLPLFSFFSAKFDLIATKKTKRLQSSGRKAKKMAKVENAEELLGELVLDDEIKTCLTENLTENELRSLSCSNSIFALAGSHENGDDDWIDKATHDGDPFIYAMAAEIRSSSARKERKLPVCRWLRMDECHHETIALVSYPRSGNSMLRGMLEQHYGIYTGSDTRPDRTLSRALRDQWGMAGEGVVDQRIVHVVKSHWPERRGWCPVKVDRVILVIRNPFDAMDSYFNMCLTNTHHLSLTENMYKKFRYYENTHTFSSINGHTYICLIFNCSLAFVFSFYFYFYILFFQLSKDPPGRK
jgi:hypothetical protein